MKAADAPVFCGGTDGAPPIVFPRVWREGLGPGQIPGGAVQGLESTAASEKTCLFSRKNVLSISSLKIVLAGIFQFDIPLVPMTKDNPSQSICVPPQNLQWNPSLCGTPVPTVASRPCWHLTTRGRFVCSAAAGFSPAACCLPFPRQRKNGLPGRRRKGWLQGNVSTAFTYTTPPHPPPRCSHGHARPGAG